MAFNHFPFRSFLPSSVLFYLATRNPFSLQQSLLEAQFSIIIYKKIFDLRNWRDPRLPFFNQYFILFSWRNRRGDIFSFLFCLCELISFDKVSWNCCSKLYKYFHKLQKCNLMLPISSIMHRTLRIRIFV